MSERELLIASKVPDLKAALDLYDGWEVMTTPTLTRAASTIVSSHPPGAVYVEDTCGTVDQLWNVVNAALEKGIPVFIGLHGIATSKRIDFENAGLPVTAEQDPAELAAWLAPQLGARARAAASGQIMVGVTSAKGGVGKTLLVANMATALKRRGLRVLVVDGDISNSSIVSTFRIPSGYLSYLQLPADGPGAFTPGNVRRYIYHHQPSGIDFLLAAESMVEWEDLTKNDWLSMMQAVRTFGEYDVVLVDTGPEILKRPYALHIAKQDNGFALLPTPPLMEERRGVEKALQVFEEWGQMTSKCFLVFIEAEKGIPIKPEQIAPLFQKEFPKTRTLGVLPRNPLLIYRAKEVANRYVSPLDVSPNSDFTMAVHEIADAFCKMVQLKATKPKPKSSMWKRLKARIGKDKGVLDGVEQPIHIADETTEVHV